MAGELEMKLLLIGPQGSGKGTQGKILQDKYGWQNISSGDLLRAEKAKDPSFEKKYGLDKGNLVPDNVIAELIEKRIKEDDCKKGYILDGFPRRVSQAKILDVLVNIDYAILIDVPDELCVERLSARRMGEDGTIYGINNPVPKGVEVYQRPDDYPEAIQHRLNQYHEETEPMLEYYKKQEKLIQIDGTGTPQEVFERVKKELKLE
ncbi:adenylate kinase [Candidatus Woesearchaeota archaeon CG10_big_fil_rev_8_21_14_0_10_30_7]|nr:MAG: adenylate kinase [Candidatus Woesearchaeota archaeon CG10_big_fil_rev_8_21_14_0_10_30_7]